VSPEGCVMPCRSIMSPARPKWRHLGSAREEHPVRIDPPQGRAGLAGDSVLQCFVLEATDS